MLSQPPLRIIVVSHRIEDDDEEWLETILFRYQLCPSNRPFHPPPIPQYHHQFTQHPSTTFAMELGYRAAGMC